MSDYEFESTLCQIPIVHVFKIPPRTTSGGHRATDWTEEVWEGKLSVIQKGSDCTIYLIDRNTNAEFARAPVSEGAVERAVDSSRYFVLRCINQNTKQKAFIGLAFNERNDAFEFNVALQDFDKFTKQQADLSKAPSFENEPAVDMSLKNKITIKASFGNSKSGCGGGASSGCGGAAARRAARQQQQGGDLIGGTPGGLLAPPKGDTPSRRQIEGTLAPPPTAGTSSNSFLGMIAPPAPLPAPTPPAAAQAPAAPAADPFSVAAPPSKPPPAPAPALASDPFAVAAAVPTEQTKPFAPAVSSDPFAAPTAPMGGAPSAGLAAAAPPSDPFAAPPSSSQFTAAAAAAPAVSAAPPPASDPFAAMSLNDTDVNNGVMARPTAAAPSVSLPSSNGGDPFAVVSPNVGGLGGSSSAMSSNNSNTAPTNDVFGSLSAPQQPPQQQHQPQQSAMTAMSALSAFGRLGGGSNSGQQQQQQQQAFPGGGGDGGGGDPFANMAANNNSNNAMGFGATPPQPSPSRPAAMAGNSGVYSSPMGMGAFDKLSEPAFGGGMAPSSASAPQATAQNPQQLPTGAKSPNLFDDLF